MKVPITARRASTAILVYFGTKLASGLFLLKLSAAMLPVAGFSNFSQFLLVGALVTSVAVGGAQNGVVRQVAVGDAVALRRAVGGAGLLWVIASTILFTIALLFQRPISEGLTGDPGYALAVPLLAAAALASGPAQIACATLTGLGRTRASLAANGVGLVIGTTASAILLFHHLAVPAALAFYAGSLAAGPIACALVFPLRPLQRMPLSAAFAAVKTLLRYSSGFVAIAAGTGLTMFALRYAYLSAFDATALGYWMVAQRISDTSTQLLGLFMTQYVIPAYAPCAPHDRRPILVRSWLLATGTTLLALIVFSAGYRLWIPLLLSKVYLPAAGMIICYMIGDIFRATALLAMHASLARARVVVYAGIELAATTLIAIITLVLIGRGVAYAPVIGYMSAYALVATIVAIWALRRFRADNATIQTGDAAHEAGRR